MVWMGADVFIFLFCLLRYNFDILKFTILYYEENSISITKTKKFISTEKKNHISLKESQVQHHHKIPRDHQIHQRCIYTYSEVSLSVEGKGLSPWQPY